MSDAFHSEDFDPEMTLPKDADADDVALAFDRALSAAPEDRTRLKRWTARFPQFADDLLAVAYARAALGLTLTGAVEDFAGDAVRVPLTSLLDDARAQGLSAQDFARRLRLDTPLLTRLNQRLLDAATLPRTLVRSAAEALDRPAGEIIAYLRRPPRLASAAQYRARQAPALEAPEARQSFGAALGRLPAADQDYWRLQEAVEGVLGEEGVPGEE